MACLESVFAALHRVYLFEKSVTLSDRKRGNLNFLLVGLGETRPNPVLDRLSFDNLSIHPHTGGY